MDAHKETFSLCCYDLQQDKILYAQKWNWIIDRFSYLNAVRNSIGENVSLYAAMRRGASGLRCIIPQTRKVEHPLFTIQKFRYVVLPELYISNNPSAKT